METVASAAISINAMGLQRFVLVPFALWNRTSFLAERVLGNVGSSGVTVMVLAVIVGIGSGFFAEFTEALNGQNDRRRRVPAAL